MLRQYNGCKWRGSVLRVELAKPAGMDRLAQERQAALEEASREVSAMAQRAAELEAEQAAAKLTAPADPAPLHLTGPGAKVCAIDSSSAMHTCIMLASLASPGLQLACPPKNKLSLLTRLYSWDLALQMGTPAAEVELVCSGCVG